MKFRARFIANVIQFAAQQGASKKELLCVVGTEMEDLNNEEKTFEAGIYNALLEKAVALTGDPYLGLHMGEYLSLSAAGLILQIVQSSGTVLEGLQYMVDFANLGCQAMPFQLQKKQEEWALSLHPNPVWEEQSPLAVRHTMDGMLIFTVREFQSLTRQKHYPKRIHFSYPRPEKFMEFERLFHCPVRFEQSQSALFFDQEQVAQTVVTSDYKLLQILVQYAEQKLAMLAHAQGFITIVKQSIINLVKPQFPTIEQVARNLNVSVRTLQRRLKEEGMTYKAVMDQLRQQFAKDYLQNNTLSVQEVAYLLDYADASSFVRAFRRWEGVSPEVYRNSKM